MTRSELLRKIIEKALTGGFCNESGNATIEEFVSPRPAEMSDHVLSAVFHLTIYDDKGESMTLHHYEQISGYPALLYSPSFAKAFWGLNDWKSSLQQLVLEEDPVVYLAQFLQD